MQIQFLLTSIAKGLVSLCCLAAEEFGNVMSFLLADPRRLGAIL